MRVVRAWLGAALLLAASLPSAHAADALVLGRIVDARGRPAPGVPVALVPRRNTAADIVGAFTAVFTIGISCIAGAPPCDKTPSVSTTTGPDGRFGFDGVQVAKVGSNAVLVAGAPGGPTVRAQITVDRVLDLGDLAFWEPGLTVASTGPRTAVSWRAPPDANERTVVRLTVAGRSVRVATGATGAKGSAAYDRRAVEDHYVEAILDAGFNRPRAGGTVRVDWTSAPRPLPAAGPPISRGRACTADGVGVPACPATDGIFGETGLCDAGPDPATSGCLPVTTKELVVDLGAARPLDVVALTGTVAQAVVELSAEQRTWRVLAERPGDGTWPADVYEAGGPPARWIRVRSRAQGPTLGVREVSAWPPDRVPEVFPPRPAAPTPTPIPPAAQPTQPVATSPPVPTGAAAVPPPNRALRPALVAFALLLVVGLATCIVAARATPRRRPAAPPPYPAPWPAPGGTSPPAAGWPVPYQPPAPPR